MHKICLVFWKSEPQYAYKDYAYKKTCIISWYFKFICFRDTQEHDKFEIYTLFEKTKSKLQRFIIEVWITCLLHCILKRHSRSIKAIWASITTSERMEYATEFYISIIRSSYSTKHKFTKEVFPTKELDQMQKSILEMKIYTFVIALSKHSCSSASLFW